MYVLNTMAWVRDTNKKNLRLVVKLEEHVCTCHDWQHIGQLEEHGCTSFSHGKQELEVGPLCT